MLKKFPLLYDFLRFSILPLKEIDKSLPDKGKIIELGCGEGVIAKYLAQNPKRDVIGIDNDKKRLPKTGFQNLQFKEADIRNYDFNETKGIVVSDVLHHLNFDDQKKIFSKISRSFKKDNVLVIKEIDTQEFIRSRLSRFWDFVFYPQDKIYYWSSKKLQNYLTKLNFKVDIFRPTRFFPGSTTLFVCTKK